jgi:hypothetical protein
LRRNGMTCEPDRKEQSNTPPAEGKAKVRLTHGVAAACSSGTGGREDGL